MPRTGTRWSIATIAVVAALLATASAHALTPPLPYVHVHVGETWADPSNFETDPMRPVVAPPLVQASALPFNATIRLGSEPASIAARLVGPDGQPLPQPVTMAPVEPQVWSLSFAEAVPDLTRVVLEVAVPQYGTTLRKVFVVHGVAPAPRQEQPTPTPTPAPAPVVAAPPVPQASIVGVARHGARAIVRVRTNVAGRLRVGARQGQRVRTWERGGLPAGTHRIVLPLPRPGRQGVAFALRLTDASGASTRAAARIG